jgi:hypothetical protein
LARFRVEPTLNLSALFHVCFDDSPLEDLDRVRDWSPFGATSGASSVLLEPVLVGLICGMLEAVAMMS